MKFLITNDDGYQSLGLKKLVNAALKYGEVYVVAPKVEQSGVGQCVVYRTGYKLNSVEDIIPGVKTWSVESTPADCVRIAHYYLHLDFDIVLSGINSGFNIGNDIAYSGTCGAAAEAIMCGKKAIAFSTDRGDYSGIDELLEKVMNHIFENNILDIWNFYNINIPKGAKDIKYVNQGSIHYDTIYNEAADGYIESEPIVLWTRLDNKETDIDCVHDLYITITPLLVDRTNYDILNMLKNK